METLSTFCRRLQFDQQGTAVIEAAFVLPILCLLSFGALEASHMVARNAELRMALDETAAITLVQPPQDATELAALEGIVEASTGLPDAAVTLSRRFRCGTAEVLIADENFCPSTILVSHYLAITVSDTYTPRWVSFGIGAPVSVTLTRTVQIG